MKKFPYSPWPDPGKWFHFRSGMSVRVMADPAYDRNWPSLHIGDLKSLEVRYEESWFFSMNIPGVFHFYYGDRPFTMDDPGFYYRDHPLVATHRNMGRLFTQPGRKRWGFGGIS